MSTSVGLCIVFHDLSHVFGVALEVIAVEPSIPIGAKEPLLSLDVVVGSHYFLVLETV